MAEVFATGIKGFDKLFKLKGMKAGTSLLVTGTPGAGKTVFALEYLYRGAEKGEIGMYIAYEESANNIRALAESLGFDRFAEFEKKKTIVLIEQPAAQSNITTVRIPFTLMQKNGVKRVVLDSLTLFEYVFSTDVLKFRRGILKFLADMRDSGVNILVTSERKMGTVNDFQFEPQDFLFDGVLALYNNRKGSTHERCLNIIKMRRQGHVSDIIPFTITGKGLEVFPEQIPFSLVDKD